MDFIRAASEEVIFHLPRQVLAGTRIGQVQAIFIDQHGLLFHPVGPSLFADLFPQAFSQRSRVRREVQALGLTAQFDSVDGACHVDFFREMSL